MQRVHDGNLARTQAAHDPRGVELRPGDVDYIGPHGVDNLQHARDPAVEPWRPVQCPPLPGPNGVHGDAGIVQRRRISVDSDQTCTTASVKNSLRQVGGVQVHAVGAGEENVKNRCHGALLTPLRER